jgi:hypothetical protein
MARAGQQVLREGGRLEDRISVGVLARAFPPGPGITACPALVRIWLTCRR